MPRPKLEKVREVIPEVSLDVVQVLVVPSRGPLGHGGGLRDGHHAERRRGVGRGRIANGRGRRRAPRAQLHERRALRPRGRWGERFELIRPRRGVPRRAAARARPGFLGGGFVAGGFDCRRLERDLQPGARRHSRCLAGLPRPRQGSFKSSRVAAQSSGRGDGSRQRQLIRDTFTSERHAWTPRGWRTLQRESREASRESLVRRWRSC